jgi:hypothetical protein
MKVHDDGRVSPTRNSERRVAIAVLEEVMKRIGSDSPALPVVSQVASEVRDRWPRQSREWTNCPICGEPDMLKEPEGGDGGFLIYCDNLDCASNGGRNASALPHTIWTNVSQSTYEALVARAKARGLTVAGCVREILTEELKRT